MKTIKSIIAALILTVGSLSLAQAQTRFHVSINTPGVHVSAGNYHRAYYSPGYYEPVYQPYYQPVVYHRYYSRPVVYRSYYSRPVVYREYYRHDNGRHLGWYKGHGHGRW
ncbi:hypothetical protein [Mucilaginibacter boryungensis]|uniref:Uncharacterized protein n=1 Tax=Mucilaginibacter boryungensis TaxID=768480 RepID=A0ABR9XKB4_9SPHI|nr:hypothetical protein [Mucilaginibacter boryungensis]MBE9667832.1 hypothetical protein [Mucilaginibacter boryungensis]